MKIAVCVSGAFTCKNTRGSLALYNTILKQKFPHADFFYATWETFRPNFEQIFPEQMCAYLPEINMSYHPYFDIPNTDYVSHHFKNTIAWVHKGGDQRREWTSHHTKQILIHAWLVSQLPQPYDIIVRTRFDALIAKEADFSSYIRDSYTNSRANGFAATKKHKFSVIREFDRTKASMHDSWLADQLIIHPLKCLDTAMVRNLHTQKILHAAEYGWYQVLSKPYGSNHRNHDGWVNHDRNVLDENFWNPYDKYL